MKIVIQKKNKKWYLGTWENNVFTREKTYVKINGSGVKKEKLPVKLYEEIIIQGPSGILQVYGVKEEVVKARGRKADPTKPKIAKHTDLVDINKEDMTDAKKEKAFEKKFWKVKHPRCLKCSKTCKQSAMVSLYCPSYTKGNNE
jgi:hypothetical protein